MKTIIGVNFRRQGKIYYFDPAGLDIRRGDHVIVETAQGPEYASVVLPPCEVEDDKVTGTLKQVVRVADEDDDDQIALNQKNEMDAIRVCKQKVAAHGLEMKLIRAEYAFDRSKLTFFFTADGRVDFRELVKDLASVFRTRIELRQVGVRDETKLLGGIGVCGRELCCATWLPDFVPVSIKMAKEQNLSLNSAKISGVCGRLMCCLKNEAETYEYLNSQLPRMNAVVRATDGCTGTVKGVNVLLQTVDVMIFEDKDEKEVRTYRVDELKFGQALRQDLIDRGEDPDAFLAAAEAAGNERRERERNGNRDRNTDKSGGKNGDRGRDRNSDKNGERSGDKNRDRRDRDQNRDRNRDGGGERSAELAEEEGHEKREKRDRRDRDQNRDQDRDRNRDQERGGNRERNGERNRDGERGRDGNGERRRDRNQEQGEGERREKRDRRDRDQNRDQDRDRNRDQERGGNRDRNGERNRDGERDRNGNGERRRDRNQEQGEGERREKRERRDRRPEQGADRKESAERREDTAAKENAAAKEDAAVKEDTVRKEDTAGKEAVEIPARPAEESTSSEEN